MMEWHIVESMILFISSNMSKKEALLHRTSPIVLVEDVDAKCGILMCCGCRYDERFSCDILMYLGSLEFVS
jgi:hypothetical protein